MPGLQRCIVCFASLATACFIPAYADMSAPCGWYLEANFGSSHISNQTNNTLGTVNESGIGANANLGYKFMPYVGMEIGYTQYANSTYKFENTTAGNAKNYSYDVALRGIVPIGATGFELFAKLGVGRANVNISVKNQDAADAIGLGHTRHSKTGLFYGSGAQYYLMPEFAVNVQWAEVLGDHSTGNQSLFSVGISFLFV